MKIKLFLFFLICLFSINSFASQPQINGYSIALTGQTVYPDMTSACDGYLAIQQSASIGSGFDWSFVSVVGQMCNYKIMVGTYHYSDPSQYFQIVTSCPSGTHLNNAGSCDFDNQCADKQGTSAGVAYVSSGTSLPTTTAQLKSCTGGCETVPTSLANTSHAYMNAGSPNIYYSANLMFTGALCTVGTVVSDSVAPTDSCASGDVAIKINGKNSCVTPDPVSPVVKAVLPTVTNSKPNPQTNPPTSTTTTTTNPVNPTTPSTQTTNTYTYDTSTGAVTSVSSSNTTVVNNTYNTPTDGVPSSDPLDISSLSKEVTQAGIHSDTTSILNEIKCTDCVLPSDTTQANKDLINAETKKTTDMLTNVATTDYEHFENDLGWTTWVPTFPTGSCTPFIFNVLTQTVHWDFCPYIAKLNELLGWLFALFGAWTITAMFFGKE